MLLYPCNICPLVHPLLYGKTGVNMGIFNFFLFLSQNIDCGSALEPPQNSMRRILMCTHNLCFGEHKKGTFFFFHLKLSFL